MELSSATIPSAAAPDSARTKVKSPYLPHLDGLRAIAIIGILLEHLNLPMPALLRCGPLSVRFFFVLTGYFITLSLWKVKDELAASEDGSYVPLYRYYFARLLRTGPPFYCSLLIGAIFGIEEVRTNFFWLATFQANNFIAYLGYWPDAISHYWSLAVQEQFYFLWPLLVLTLPRRWFLPAMAAFIVFGLGFRLVCIATEASTITRWVTLFGCIDSFAVGALIAYLKEIRALEKMHQLSSNLRLAWPLAAFSCFFLAGALMTLPENNIWLGLTETLDSVFLAWLLISALGEVQGHYRRWLSWAPLVYLGKISYGLYVYHVFIIVLVSPVLLSFGLSEDHGALARLAILFGLSVALASLSWHWLEQPFLVWKDALKTRPRQIPVPMPEAVPVLAR